MMVSGAEANCRIVWIPRLAQQIMNTCYFVGLSIGVDIDDAVGVEKISIWEAWLMYSSP